MAWEGVNNSFSILLKPGVVIDWRMCEEFWVNLWPMDKQKDYGEPPPPQDKDYYEEEVPF